MNQHKSMHLYACRPRRIATFLLVASALFCTLAGFIVTPPAAQAQEIPGGNVANPVISAVDIAEPAIVRIITSVPGRLTVNFTAGNSVTFPRDGTSYPLDISGSGSFISAHGDIVTADHVVRPPEADMTDFLYQTAAQDIADYLNNTFNMNPPYNADQVYNALATGTFRSDPQFDAPTSKIYLSAAYTGPQSARTFKNVAPGNFASIDAIKQESPFNKQDLAIIHVAMNDTPSIALGDSTSVSQQDELTIIGFPGNADITQRDDPTQLLTASVNKVLVSAIKQDDDGTPLLQVSGNVEHGDSGGPALDSRGNIVGIVSFQKDSMGQPNSTSFLHVSENVQQMIKTLKLNTTPGKFQQQWEQGFRDYASTSAGHWHKADQDFSKLAANYPAFNGLKPFLIYTQAQAKNERLPEATTPKSTTSQAIPYLLVGIGIVLLLVIGIFLFRRNKRKSPYTYLPNFQANTAMATGNVPNPSPYSNLSLPASTPQQAVQLTPWEQQIADSSTWKPASTSASRELPYTNPTPWNTPAVTPNAPNYANSGTTGEINGYGNRQPAPFAKELPAAWSSEDAIIVDPLPYAPSAPHYGANPQAENKEITNKREAIQKERERRQEVNQQSMPMGNNNPQAGFDWPLPATWQQIQTPAQDASKEPTQQAPQRDFGGATNFDFNRGRQP